MEIENLFSSCKGRVSGTGKIPLKYVIDMAAELSYIADIQERYTFPEKLLGACKSK